MQDTNEVVDHEFTEYEVRPGLRHADRRGIHPVPRRPNIQIDGYAITQPEPQSHSYDYVAIRLDSF